MFGFTMTVLVVRFRKALMALVAMSVSAGAYAGSVNGAVITGLGIDTQIGNVAYISLNIAKSTNASCSANTAGNFVFVLPLTTALENQMLAVLLTARASQIPVANLTGNGLCDTVAGIETLVAFTL